MLNTLYAAVARGRRQWFDRHPEARRHLARPVVSVGNLAVGGSGKTPVVAHLARLLLAEGERPAVLSRGNPRPPAPPAPWSDTGFRKWIPPREGALVLVAAGAVPGARTPPGGRGGEPIDTI